MELLLLINGQKCEIKFEKHHNFGRVINLLKQNKVIPPEVDFDKIQIIGKDGRHFTKNNNVIQSLVPPETSKCQVKIKYASSLSSSILSNSKQSMIESQGVKKARLVDIVKGFFQKMQKHDFRKLQKYQNHHEEIVSEIAQFAGKYEKMYALNLYYKDKIIKLSLNQAVQLQEYRQKFRQLFNREEEEIFSNLRQIIKNDNIIQQETSRIGQESREIIEQKQERMAQLQKELQVQKIKFQQAFYSYSQEIDTLKDELAKYDQKSRELQRKIDILSQQIHNLELILTEKTVLINKLQEQLDNLSTDNKHLLMQSRMYKNEISQQVQKTKCLLMEKQIINAQLESKYHYCQINLAELKNKNCILQVQKQSLTKKLSQLERELEKNKVENTEFKNTHSKLHKLHSLHLKTKRSTSYLEEIPYEQPILKLNECFNSELANIFIQQQEKYLSKKLTKITKIIHHPATLNIPTNKILKKIRGKSNILLVCITQQDRVVGGFSSLAIDDYCTKEKIKACKAFVFNIVDGQINLFKLKQGRHPVKYDQHFFILGEEEFMIDYQTLTLQSRFVTMSDCNSSFQDSNYRRKFLLSLHQTSIVKLKEYWLFDCTFE